MRVITHYCKRFIAVALLLLAGASTGFAQEKLWEVEFPSDVKWQQLTETGHLVVCTDKALMGLNPETGEKIWTLEDFGDLDQEKFDLITLTPYALITKGKGVFGSQTKLILLDITTGQEAWNTEALGITSSFGHFLLMPTNSIMIYGSTGKNVNDRDLLTLDLATGKLLWKDEEFKKYKPELLPVGKSKSKVSLVGNQDPLFDTDSTMILFMSKEGPRRVNANTGAILWQTKLKMKYVPVLSQGFCPMLYDNANGIVYTPADQSVFAVKVSDGSSLWAKPPKLRGLVYQMTLTSSGLVVKGGPNAAGEDGKPFITVLDLKTGEEKWKKEFTKLKEGTNYVVKDDRVIVYADKRLYGINLESGEYKELSKDVKFEGDEVPSSLRMTDKGYGMSSSQNVMMIDFNGGELFHTYYKAPGMGMFGKIAGTMLVLGVNALSAAEAHQRAYNSAMAGGSGQASYTLMKNPYIGKRYKASVSADSYVYMLTDVKTDAEDGPGLVKVNKDTGAADKKIVLGTKKPEYELDEIEGRLFFLANDKKIVAYNF